MKNQEILCKSNVVNKKAGLGGIIPILVYLLILAGSIMVFWIESGRQDGTFAMGYSILFIWIAIPISIFAVSMIIGVKNYMGNFKWLWACVFGLTYMILPYATFGIANNIAYGNTNVPDIRMLIIGACISIVGIVVGHFMYREKNKEHK